MKQLIYNKNHCLIRTFSFLLSSSQGWVPCLGPSTRRSTLCGRGAQVTPALPASTGPSTSWCRSPSSTWPSTSPTTVGELSCQNQLVSAHQLRQASSISLGLTRHPPIPFSVACVTFIPQHTSKRDKDVTATSRSLLTTLVCSSAAGPLHRQEGSDISPRRAIDPSGVIVEPS